MTTIESFLASQTVKVVTFPYPEGRLTLNERSILGVVEIIVTIFVILVLVNIYIYIYNKNNNSIFNISACLINNQSKLYLMYNVFNLSQPRHLINF